jgi:serine/threonine-protein kinase
MNPGDTIKNDEQFDRWLAAGDEALAAGSKDLPSCLDAAPSALRPRLERELAWCHRVRELWPQLAASTKLETAETLPGAPTASQLPAASQIGRFLIRRELGRGGFGVVFLAFDPRLGREVALKVPREASLLSPQLRERFRQEGRVAANLDHPNIVQVFEAGETAGICYIASAYCPGADLAAWLGKHALDVPADEAAAFVATLARAMAHAHDRGVLHRDLKPANILLQKQEAEKEKLKLSSDATSPESANAGEALSITEFIPKITDFGLAKLLEDQVGELAIPNPTQSGAIIGTPAYMAPEQAAGAKEAVGPAADIFALGAILYEVLTGRPPFQGETHLDILLEVRTADPLSPRKLRPRLPRDLETICLKCLAKEPSRRYLQARELALDLDRYLAREPIRARPASALERSVKWARRRPALAGLAGVSLLSGIAIFAVVSVSNVLLTKERDSAKHHEQEAEAQRQLAVAHLREACDAVDRLTQVGFETLGTVPYMETVRRDLLRDAVRLYQGFVQEENDDPDLRFETGRTWRRLGKIHQDLGEYKPALESFRAALAMQVRLFTEFPDKSAIRTELAACYNNLGNLLWEAKLDLNEAQLAVLEALRMQEELASEFPGATNRKNLAESYDGLGRILLSLKQVPQAEDAFRRSVSMLEQLVAEQPQEQTYATNLASRRRNLAVFLANQRRLPEATPLFRADLQFWQAREAEAPDEPRYQGRVADASKHLGSLLIDTGDAAEGEVLINEALKRWQRLADQFPMLPQNHQNLAAGKDKLARLYRSRDDQAGASDLLQQSIAHWQTCHKVRPPTQEHRVWLGSDYWLLADSQLQLGAHVRSADCAEKLHRLCFDRWQEHYQAARLLTRCVQLARKDVQLSESAKRDLVERYSAQSVEMLREAFRLGYKDLAFVDKDPGLDVLRKRADFKQLLEGEALKAKSISGSR